MPDTFGSSSGKSLSSFWSRPEGKTGMIFGAGLIGFVGWGLYKILPFAITLVSNLLYLSLLCVGLATVLYVVFDGQARALVWNIYRSLMRFLTGLVIEMDPIGIVRNYILELKRKIQELNQQISIVKGQIRSVDAAIATNKAQQETSMQLASTARKAGKENVLYFQARQAGRLDKSTATLSSMKQRLELVYRVLLKLQENAGLKAQDMEQEVEVRQREYSAMKAARSALRSAFEVLTGDTEKRDVFDRAMDFMANDIAMANGEIDTFLDTSRGFLESLDLENMSYEQSALDKLDEWEKNSDNLLINPDEKRLLLAESTSPMVKLDVSKSGDPVKRAAAGDTFDEFLGGGSKK